MKILAQMFTQLGVLTAHPAAFAIVVAYGMLWLIFEPATFDWHGIATLATWMMTLFIQRAEHRDTQAIHGKLDELLRTDKEARSDLARLDDREPEEIEQARNQANKGEPR